MLITGGNNETVHFFESNGSDLASPTLVWNRLHDWNKEELIGGTWPTGDAHQMLQFIRERGLGGRLYLAGARSEGRSTDSTATTTWICMKSVSKARRSRSPTKRRAT